MKFTIFYSWQADTDRRLNFNFIEYALKKAIKNINREQIELDIAIDRDTKDTPGSPAIAETILSKIGSCGLFVCDVSIINSKEAGKKTPNPNVLLELGYAIAKIGHSRVICVMNTLYGNPQDNDVILPFDIRHLRWPIRYHYEGLDKPDSLQALVKQLEQAIKTPIENGLLVKSVNLLDKRLAQKLENALVHMSIFLDPLLRSVGQEALLQIFQQRFDDKPGTIYPDPIILDEIVDVIAATPLLEKSNMTQDSKPLTWAACLMWNFQQSYQETTELLERFSNRDENLVLVIEELNNRLGNFIKILSLSSSIPQVVDSWHNKGLSDYLLDAFRYLYLVLLKARRVISEYKI